MKKKNLLAISLATAALNTDASAAENLNAQWTAETYAQSNLSNSAMVDVIQNMRVIDGELRLAVTDINKLTHKLLLQFGDTQLDTSGNELILGPLIRTKIAKFQFSQSIQRSGDQAEVTNDLLFNWILDSLDDEIPEYLEDLSNTPFIL